MRTFFLFETELEENSGFALFGLCHLLWLFFLAGFTWWLLKQYQKKRIDSQRKLNRIIGTSLPVMQICRDMILGITGYYNIGFLPLHLCNMALIIACLYAWTENKFWGNIYVLLCLPGAAGALLFPDWRMYPFFNYMHIYDFISHGLTVAFGICLLVTGKVEPKWKDFWMPLVFGLIGFICLPVVNQKLETNFWFLTIPTKNSPLEMIFNLTGEIWYRIGYFLFVLLIVVVWQMIICIGQRKRKEAR